MKNTAWFFSTVLCVFMVKLPVTRENQKGGTNMKFNQIRKMAKEMGINTYRMKKIEHQIDACYASTTFL